MEPQKRQNNLRFGFFGTDNLAVNVLEEFKSQNVIPDLIITTPPKPKGRNLVLSPSPVEIWAKENNIEFINPTRLNDEVFENLKNDNLDLFIVVSYGKIIPEKILELPKYKTINLHPSLLPKLRGPSPIQYAILNENETGVSIIKIDKEVDHGPIIAQEKINIEWPPYYKDLEKESAIVGSKLLLNIMQNIDNLKEKEQDHSLATFTKKIEKKDGEINLEDSPLLNLRKIRSYHVWPGAFYFDNGKRIIIRKARLEENKLILEKVLPEGKKEMSFEDYLRGKK